jgi:hypothetical protein
MSAHVHELRRLPGGRGDRAGRSRRDRRRSSRTCARRDRLVGDGERVDVFPARTVDALPARGLDREGTRDLRVLDLRGEPVPGAARSHPPKRRTSRASIRSRGRTMRPSCCTRPTICTVRDAQAWAKPRVPSGHKDAYVLDGGMDAWLDEVMEPCFAADPRGLRRGAEPLLRRAPRGLEIARR